VGLLQDETGSGKPKMATSEMELVISQLLDEIETKFRRLDLHFRGPAFEWHEFKYCPTKPEVENPIWRPPNRKYLYLTFQMRYKQNKNGLNCVFEVQHLNYMSGFGSDNHHFFLELPDILNTGFAGEIVFLSRLQAYVLTVPVY
jgi:hypothetical protein